MNEQLRPLLTLAWLRLRLLSRLGVNRYTRRAMRAAPVRLLIVAGVLIWVLIVLVVPLIHLIGSATGQANLRSLLQQRLTGWLSIAAIFIFFYAVITWVNTLTSGGDIRLLLLSPIPPRLVIAEKFIAACLGFVLIMLLTLPAIIGLGNSLHLGQTYDVAAVAIVLFLPVMPVSLALLFVLIVIRLVPPGRARTIATVLGTLIGAAFYIGTQSLLGQTSSGAASTPPSLPPFLPTSWPGRFLTAVGLGDTGTALLYLLATLSFSILLATLAVNLSARLFVTGSASYMEVARASAKRSLRATRVTAFGTPNSASTFAAERPIWWPLFQKEWLTLRRDPQRLALMVYPLLIVGFLSYRTVSGFAPAATAHGFGQTTGFFYLTLILASILVTGSFAPTVINREGRSLYLLALAPLTPRAILASKWAISIGPPVIVTEALLAVGIVGLQIDFAEALVDALALALLATALSGLYLVINLIWPKLSDVTRRQASLPAQLLGFISAMIVGLVVWAFLNLAVGGLAGGTAVAVVGIAGLILIPGVVIFISIFAGPRLMRNLLTSERARS